MHKFSRAVCSALVLLLPFVWSAIGVESECDAPGADACTGEEEDTSALQLRAAAAAPERNENSAEKEALEVLALAPSFHRMRDYWRSHLQATRSCYLRSADDCPITNSTLFQPKSATRIYPGGKTVCIDGSEFFFEVTKGKSKKLHIHFQQGGACWDAVSYRLPGACWKNATPNPPEGLFNMSDSRNPIKDYSIIVIQYCGGDMHTGRAEQKGWSSGRRRTTVKQYGYYNADSAIQYALRNFPKLQNLVISGSSAGSLGTQYWVGKLIELFSDRNPQVSVIADSFLGILWPPGKVQTSETWLFEKYKMCNPAVLTPAQMTKCDGKSLLLQDMFADAIRANPKVRFSTINSKADRIQRAFEKAFELTAELNIRGSFMTIGDFYKSASLQVEEYLQYSNFYSYFVTGETHTFVPDEYLYTTSPNGKSTSGSPMLIDWLTDFFNLSKTPMKRVCAGQPKMITSRTRVGRTETDYCAVGMN